MAVICPQSNTVEIQYTEGCRAEIRSTEDCRPTEALKHGRALWKFNLQKAVYLRKTVDLRKTINNMELVLKLRGDSSSGFMEAVKG